MKKFTAVAALLVLSAGAILFLGGCDMEMESAFLEAIQERIAEDEETAQAETTFYSVTYFGNGADSGTPPVDVSTYKAGDAATVMDSGTLIKTGYNFDSWNMSEDGSNTSYNTGETFLIGAADTSLYAQWTPAFTVSSPHFNPEGGGYSQDLSITITSSTEGAAIYYTTTGEAPTRNSLPYTAPVTLSGDGAALVLKAFAVKAGMNDSAVATANYTIDYSTMATPQFSKSSGTYDVDLSVTITSSTPEAVIYYTSDGSTPDSSDTLYSGPVSVSGDATSVILKAVATKAGMNDSSVASASYVIDYLDTPTGLNAQDGVSTSGIGLTWNGTGTPVTPEYLIYRNTTNSIPASYHAGTASTGYTDTDAVTPGTLYYYWVRGHNPVSGAYSGFSAPNTGFRKLGSPGSFSASDGASTSNVSLSWSSVSGATAYYVFRNTVNALPSSALTSTTGTTYSDASAAPGVSYYYWVRTYSSSSSSYSEPASDTGYRKLSAPSGVSATDGSSTSSIGVSWNAVTGASSYYIYRSTSNSFPGDPAYSITSNTSLTDSSVSVGTTYYYWVKTYSSSSQSQSDPSASDGGYIKISAPASLSASDGSSTSGITINWSGVANASGYYIYRNTINSLPSSYSSYAAGSAVSYNDTSSSLNPGQYYYYWIRAVVENPFHTGDATGPDTGYKQITAPASISATDFTRTTDVYISWSTVTGATEYHVFRNTSATLPSTAIGSSTGSYFTDDSAVPGRTYYYWVKAYDSSPAHYSAASAYDTGSRKLSPPANFTASKGLTTQINLSWSHSTGATKYHVYRQGTLLAIANLQLLPGDSWPATVTYTTYGSANVNYTYWVTAECSLGYSDSSNTDWGYQTE